MVDFSLSAAQEKRREEYIRFFKKEMEEAPPGWTGGIEEPYANDDHWDFHCRMAGKLGNKGWLTQAWPKEWRGLNASPVDQMIFNEVAGYFKAPGIDLVGIKMMGPIIYTMGSREQKEEHLKPIARGERFWCQGWSEPDAGSDLASLSTKAIKKDDYYAVSGQKIWTTGAHKADWACLLVRTDPESRRSEGLTFLLADLKTPGFTIQPIRMMNGSHSFNEIFLDEVKIPVKNIIGQENQGWGVTKVISNFERSGSLPVSYIERVLHDLINYCRGTEYQGDFLTKHQIVRHRLATLAVEVEVAKALSYRLTCLQDQSDPNTSTATSSATRVYLSELNQRLIYDGCRILGLLCQIKKGSGWAPLKGGFERDYQLCMGRNIGAGTSEIQRNVIAWSALGLPRR